MPHSQRLRTGLLSLICLLFALHSLYWIRLPGLDQLERASYDLRLQLTAPYGIDQRIVIADIDEKSLAALGQWPWSRALLADLMDTLFDHYQVKVVGYDVLFAEPETDRGVAALQQLASHELKNNRQFQTLWRTLSPSLDADQRFADSLRNRPVVLGYVFVQSDQEALNALPAPLLELPESVAGTLSLFQPQRYTSNLPLLQDATPWGGFFDNPAIDVDGVFRRVPLIQEHQGQVYGSLALTLALVALDHPPVNLVLDPHSRYAHVDGLQVGDHTIPLAPGATVLVPYRGPSGSFPYVSISDILDKRVPLETLRDRILLVGTSAHGLKDQRTTPFETTYPGVEVHANLVAGLLDNAFLHQPGWLAAVELLMVLLLSLGLGMLNARLEPLRSLMVSTTALLLVVLVNLWQWQAGLVLPLAAPVLLIVVIFMFQTVWGFFVEARNKRRLASVFGQYIPPELVAEMADSPEPITTSGESREMTVLFSDVRGFTTLSEGLDPEQLTHLMNEMLTPMTRIIHQHRGTIDKYMGDAIMAFWGAPLKDPQHALHALQAAMAMVEALPEINHRFAAKGWPAINIGVGLNTGLMSVGNMGSEFRMAYTVMGDAVNLGSRLEGLTKSYGVNLIVSEFTRQQVPEYSYRELDLVRVKGKDEPVAIFEPVGPTSTLPADTLQQLSALDTAISAYRQQLWDDAENLLRDLQQHDPERPLYSLYLERIAHFRLNPPGDAWDGVYTHTSK